jgi:hypothetical protein
MCCNKKIFVRKYMSCSNKIYLVLTKYKKFKASRPSYLDSIVTTVPDEKINLDYL